jgi:hypothetical protein
MLKRSPNWAVAADVTVAALESALDLLNAVLTDRHHTHDDLFYKVDAVIRLQWPSLLWAGIKCKALPFAITSGPCAS